MWLKDVEYKGKGDLERQRQAKLEAEHAAQEEQLLAERKDKALKEEFARLAPVVQRLLGELCKWWQGESQHLGKCVVASYGDSWRVENKGFSEWWSVNLLIDDELHKIFYIGCALPEGIITEDSSESALTIALRQAAAAGPQTPSAIDHDVAGHA